MENYCPSPAASKLFIPLDIARDTSRCCGVRDVCCSRAMCARTSWASAIPSASRIWRKVVRVRVSLPAFHSMLPGSATASLSPAMHRRSSAISGASNWLRDVDVADAIEALVGPPERRSLPVAFDKNAIVQKFVEIAHTDEDGIVDEQTAIAARSLTEMF